MTALYLLLAAAGLTIAIAIFGILCCRASGDDNREPVSSDRLWLSGYGESLRSDSISVSYGFAWHAEVFMLHDSKVEALFESLRNQPNTFATIWAPRAERWRSGWPFYAFSGDICWHTSDWTTQRQVMRSAAAVDAQGLIRIPSRQPPTHSRAAFMPYRPIVVGFALNTLFYGILLLALRAAIVKQIGSRRLRQGLCPQCKYPIGASETCTECGKPVRERVSA
ncbi:MAG: hypothetical protein L0219_13300 [Phycisphaerales bacterium]|nr:hypothetical protein [Phycisphaerales bacterium]MCI0674763.1 hypothetical protein [Phycisphaerales bacterium]